MLFDLRSRNRRTAVRIIYFFLAFVMAAGLIGVGVGTGVGGGGLLNAFDGNGGSGSSSGNSAATKQVTAAIAQTQANPKSPAAWLALMEARFEQAQSSTKYYSGADSSSTETGTYTAAGQTILNQGIAAWQQYLKVTKNNPSLTGTELAHSMYAGTGNYAGLIPVYQYWIAKTPNAPGPYMCLALAAYSASNNTVGDPAANKAKELTAKASRSQIATIFTASRKSSSTAKEYFTYECS